MHKLKFQIFSVEYYKYGFVKNWCMLKLIWFIIYIERSNS